MPHARTSATSQHEAPALVRANDLGHEWKDRIASAIEDTLPTDADQIEVGQNPQLAVEFGRVDHATVNQRLAHETPLDVNPLVGMTHNASHSDSLLVLSSSVAKLVQRSDQMERHYSAEPSKHHVHDRRDRQEYIDLLRSGN